ncbi:MAG: right-handed parallel beta-helix repeat-containing protein [Planctomycetes bacterium]|nr:right-handed parallel beta-helix repeat-containing protein [Planctomycetota bacterium]
MIAIAGFVRLAAAAALVAVVAAPALGCRKLSPASTVERAGAGAREARRATIVVKAGERIQDAVDRAGEGDVIGVEPGVYQESVLITTPRLTLFSMTEGGRAAVLDGSGVAEDGAAIRRPDGFSVTGASGLVLEGFCIQSYAGNGVKVTESSDVVLRDLTIHDAGLYGVYPVACVGTVVERCRVSRIADAGIYAGLSRRCVIRDNECFDNVAGIEIENSDDCVVTGNSCHHNTAGILVFVLPNLPVKVGRRNEVRDNRVQENNLRNWGKPDSVIGELPEGCGVIVMAADDTLVTGNVIEGNRSFGVGVLSLTDINLPESDAIDVEPNSDRTTVRDNLIRDNGARPAAKIAVQGLPGVNLFWNLRGQGNCWREETTGRFPETLPLCR